MDGPKSFVWYPPFDLVHKLNENHIDTDILYLNVAGTNVIILDTLETATDFLEKKSSIYSGRYILPMVHDLMGWDFHFAGMDYGALYTFLVTSIYSRTIWSR